MFLYPSPASIINAYIAQNLKENTKRKKNKMNFGNRKNTTQNPVTAYDSESSSKNRKQSSKKREPKISIVLQREKKMMHNATCIKCHSVNITVFNMIPYCEPGEKIDLNIWPQIEYDYKRFKSGRATTFRLI